MLANFPSQRFESAVDLNCVFVCLCVVINDISVCVCVCVCFVAPIFIGKTQGITMVLMGCIPTQSMTVIGVHAQMLMHWWFLCVYVYHVSLQSL